MSKYAPSAWMSDELEIECPSGQLCLARKLQMEDIVKMGMIDELDMFTDFAANLGGEDPQAKVSDSKAEVAGMELMKDKDKFSKLISMVDKVVEATVLEPKIHRPVKTDKKGREVELTNAEMKESGKTYTSYVGFEDKMHIFDQVFSGATIEQFREESDEAV